MESAPLRDYMHLVDRIDQENGIYTRRSARFPENDLAPPFVVMISGVFEDEVNLMLERIVKQSMLVFYPPQKRVPYALEMGTVDFGDWIASTTRDPGSRTGLAAGNGRRVC